VDLTVRNYKLWRGGSGAFSCTLYVDGRRAALVMYDGKGGPFMLNWAPSDRMRCGGPLCTKVQAWVEALPRVCDPQTGILKRTLDSIIDKCIAEFLEAQQLRRWCRSKTVVRIPGDKEGTYRTWSWLPTSKLRKHIEARYPGAEILNDRFDLTA